ncbi:MAG: AbrB/MazE/SpoVT family DNA-binding domain-containing protein [Planctomycetes bacterium]|nr:AbrB/MazE/SpoVT family DNA-binding domain-containing protein [Planctomycetota bacterium]
MIRTQRIQKVGNSAAVLLPKDWLRGHRLRAGAKVTVEVSETRLTIYPELQEREIRVNAEFGRRVDRFLRKHRAILKRLS